jgi:two-component system chemotaxis response regulator CheB
MTDIKEGVLKTKKVIVIGTSAGGLKALSALAAQLPPNFPAPILIVQHISPDATGDILKDVLNQAGPLPCEHAVDGQKPKPGKLYLAISDHHLMIDNKGQFSLTKGAQENRSRPGIDPLFRSAAVAYGNDTIAVLLTGYLDDGVSGLIAVQKCGGTIIVQEPEDADYPEMPKNALAQLKPDYVLPVAQIGAALLDALRNNKSKQKAIPADVAREAMIAQRVLSDLPSVNALGYQVPFNCPGCGGVLWKVQKGTGLRYRCHVGHAYTAASLLADQSNKIEETMWTAMRMFEERRNLLTTIASEQTGASAEATLERAALSQIHIDRIRAVLLADDKGTKSDIPQ